MIISDLSYLEVVSEVSSVVGGVDVAATASAEVATNKPGDVATTATSNTNLTVIDKEGKPLNLEVFFNKLDKLVDNATS